MEVCEEEGQMKLIISGKHFELTDTVKEYATEKLKAIKKYFDHIIEVDLTLGVERRRPHENMKRAELNVWASGGYMRAESTAEDVFDAINEVVAKIERQLKKYKQKLREKKKKWKESPKHEAVPFEHVHKIIEVDGKEEEGDEEPHIIRANRFAHKPMTVSEAALQLQTLDQQFLVFSNADTNEVNVVYKRNDGTIGLIEPHPAE